MKYAIATNGDNMDSLTSDKGGRSPYYIIFENGKVLEKIRNPFAQGAGGAGFSVAYMLADKGVEKLLAPKLGGNMISALAERGVEYKEVEAGQKASEIINDL